MSQLWVKRNASGRIICMAEEKFKGAAERLPTTHPDVLKYYEKDLVSEKALVRKAMQEDSVLKAFVLAVAELHSMTKSQILDLIEAKVKL